MTKLTRNGITYNLTTSPYIVELKYRDDLIIKYYFSSELYVTKFNEKLEKNHDKIKESLSKRFKLIIDIDELSDILLYSKVETRGFFIQINDEDFKCLDTIKLTGVNQIQKS